MDLIASTTKNNCGSHICSHQNENKNPVQLAPPELINGFRENYLRNVAKFHKCNVVELIPPKYQVSQMSIWILNLKVRLDYQNR